MALLVRDSSSGAREADAVLEAQRASEDIVKYEKALARFSSQLNTCYTVHNNSHPKFIGLRKEVLQLSLLYRNQHLQVSKVFIKDLADWVGNYVELTFNDFIRNLDLIVEDAGKYSQNANYVSQLHSQLYQNALVLADKARIIAFDLDGQARSLALSYQELHNKANRHAVKVESARRMGLCMSMSAMMTPTLGMDAALMFNVAYLSHHQAKWNNSVMSAQAASLNAQRAAAAAAIISGPLAASVLEFIQAMAAAATFFQAVANEVRVLQEKAEEAKRTRDAQLEQENMRRIERHYLRMKAPAANLLWLCKAFNAKVPQFEAQLGFLAQRGA